jgi:hypothetical protein
MMDPKAREMMLTSKYSEESESEAQATRLDGVTIGPDASCCFHCDTNTASIEFPNQV